jgi:hypothetical protein
MFHVAQGVRRNCFAVSLIGLVSLAAGCGSNGPDVYPVRGKVVYPDGTTMSGGMVEFEALEGEWAGRNARGVIQEDGTYVLTTETPSDGAVAGQHRAIVREPVHKADMGARTPPSLIDPALAQYRTSNLKFEVKKQENDIDIQVYKPGDGDASPE